MPVAATPAAFRAAPTEGVYPTDVWAAVETWRKCKIIDVPDIPARPFVDRGGLVHMIVGSTSYHPTSGSSPLNVCPQRSGDPLSSEGEDGLHKGDDEWFTQDQLISKIHHHESDSPTWFEKYTINE